MMLLSVTAQAKPHSSQRRPAGLWREQEFRAWHALHSDKSSCQASRHALQESTEENSRMTQDSKCPPAAVFTGDVPRLREQKAPGIRRGTEVPWQCQLCCHTGVPGRALSNSWDGIQAAQVLLDWGQILQSTSDFLLVQGCKSQSPINNAKAHPLPSSL